MLFRSPELDETAAGGFAGRREEASSFCINFWEGRGDKPQVAALNCNIY